MMQAAPPQLWQPKIIERPRLTRRLDECGARIILLLAPAGYGKTTLARQWLSDKQHAWCSLSPASRDVAALALVIASAAREIVPEAGLKMQTRLALSPSPSAEVAVFVEMLAADLGNWPSEAWLMIDDYHSICHAPDCESLVAGLLESAPLRLLTTTRKRPAWATPRSRIYGLHHEIQDDALAMTDDEAAKVLSDPNALELAKGWPAVLGLAASLHRIEPQAELRDSKALHSFLAEELLKNAPPRIQRGLFRLSLCPDLSPQQARAILGARHVASLVDRSASLGLLTVREGTLSMHPLVRAFLQQRQRERDPQWHDEVRLVCRALIKEDLWDAAFPLVEAIEDESLLDELLSAALGPMLQSGRHSTVEGWLTRARGASPTPSAWLLLAQAELASRRGHQHTAESLAAQSARIAGNRALAVRAWNLAGRSAHIGDRYAEAIGYHGCAIGRAETAAELYDAIWGQLVATWQLDPERAEGLIDRLGSLADTSIDSRLRLLSADLHHAMRRGALSGLEDRVREGLILVSRATSPLASSSLLLNVAHWCVMTARYSEALQVVDSAMKLSSEHRLSFVLPGLLNVRAMACTGLRRWGEARRALDAAEAYADEFADTHNRVEADVIRMRFWLARRQIHKAVEATAASWHREPGPLERLEYDTTRELVWVLAGEERPLQWETGISPSTAILTVRFSTAAIRSLKSGRAMRPNLATLQRHLMHSGCVDGFLIACRACPELLVAAAQTPEFLDFVRPVLRQAEDTKLAKTIGAEFAPVRKMPLTNREREVLELIAEGLTNREIGRLLYVEEVTVKAHVRHILNKLGVRSRLEAAAKSAGH